MDLYADADVDADANESTPLIVSSASLYTNHQRSENFLPKSSIIEKNNHLSSIQSNWIDREEEEREGEGEGNEDEDERVEEEDDIANQKWEASIFSDSLVGLNAAEEGGYFSFFFSSCSTFCGFCFDPIVLPIEDLLATKQQRRLYWRLHRSALTPVDLSIPYHRKLIHSLALAAFGKTAEFTNAGVENLPSRSQSSSPTGTTRMTNENAEEIPQISLYSPLWQSIGFQSVDPSTDFRAGNLLSLEHLLFIAVHHHSIIAKVEKLQQPRKLTDPYTDAARRNPTEIFNQHKQQLSERQQQQQHQHQHQQQQQKQQILPIERSIPFSSLSLSVPSVPSSPSISKFDSSLVHYFPFALASIHISFMLSRLFSLRLSSHQRLIRTSALRFLYLFDLLEKEENSLSLLHLAIMELMQHLWIEKNAEYLQFNSILSEIEGKVKEACSTYPPTIQELVKELQGKDQAF